MSLLPPKVSHALTNFLLPSSLPISRHFMKGWRWDWVSNQAPSQPDARERERLASNALQIEREGGFAKKEGIGLIVLRPPVPTATKDTDIYGARIIAENLGVRQGY